MSYSKQNSHGGNSTKLSVTKLTGQNIKRSYKQQVAYCTKEGMDKFEEDWKCDGEAWWIHIN